MGVTEFDSFPNFEIFTLLSGKKAVENRFTYFKILREDYLAVSSSLKVSFRNNLWNTRIRKAFRNFNVFTTVLANYSHFIIIPKSDSKSETSLKVRGAI